MDLGSILGSLVSSFTFRSRVTPDITLTNPFAGGKGGTGVNLGDIIRPEIVFVLADGTTIDIAPNGEPEPYVWLLIPFILFFIFLVLFILAVR